MTRSRMTAGLSFALLLGTVLAGSPELRAEPDSPWVGVWRVELQTPTPSISLLVVSKEGERLTPVFYGESWQQRRLHSWEMNGDSLVLNSSVSARPYRMELRREGDRLSGEWALFHPQLRDKAEVTGRRIFAANHWNPNEKLRRLADASRFVDVSQFLIQNAPLESFSDFQEYWDKELKIPLFRIFYSVLYHSSVTDSERYSRMEQIWRTLKSDRFQSFSGALARERSAVVKRFKEERPELYFGNHFVSMPSAGTFDIKLEQVEDEAFAFVATESLMEAVSEDQLRHWLIRWQLKLPLFTFIPPDATSAFAIVAGEGIAAGWSVKMGFAENSAEALGVTSLGDLEGGREALRRIRPTSDPEGVSKEDLMAVAADFGDRITTTYSVQEILSLSARQWMELYVEYLSE